ncbi:NAD(P)H-hydrate dehydratase [Patescibacteria group bacterium]|nr:NAD(P)H-hydrate dehydratase [Patescibacteria group bacterium]
MKAIYQTKLLYPEILWERPVHYYKSKAGRILVVAGSRGMAGAALLTCEAAFRSGTGIVTLAFPEELKDSFTGILPEAMTLALPQTHSGSLSKKALEPIVEQIKSTDIVIVGPGLSTNTETVQLVWQLIREIKKTIILDADGLKALAYGIDAIRSKEDKKGVIRFFEKLNPNLIVTPHPGEASKILTALGTEKNLSKSEYVDSHKKETATVIFNSIGALTIVKGHETTIYNGKKLIIDKIGGPELATAGSGDVLAGVIGSFVAQNPKKPFKATATAVYLHSLAGKIAKEHTTERSVTASDIIRYLPEAIKISESE